jgi:hypothetical protein
LAYHFKFDGAKEIKAFWPTTEFDVWDRIFQGTYRIPRCPSCKEELICSSFSISREFGPGTIPIGGGVDKCTLEFMCSGCGTVIEAEGFEPDIKIGNIVSITLEKLYLTTMKQKYKLAPEVH